MKIENKAALRETLERMETGQLDAMLLEELRKEAPDARLIRQITAVLKERDGDTVPEIDNHIRQAWEQYRRKVTPPGRKRKFVSSTLVKAASVILVLLMLTVLLPQKAEATNFFRRFIAWTEDVFSFINPSEDDSHREEYAFHTNNPGLQQVYDTVTGLGITAPVVPMWLPEGYELTKCEVVENPIKKSLTANFSNSNSVAVYQLYFYSDNVTSKYYKDGEVLSETEKHGITHTILCNDDLLVAAWAKDNIECAIFIDCPEEVLMRILESIYTMEDN